MRKIKVKVESVAPLLQHRYIENKDERIPGTEEDKIEIASQYLYTNSDNEICLPARHFEGAMLKIANTIDGTIDSDIKDNVFVFPEMIELEMEDTWEVFERPITKQGTNERIVIYTPKIDNWSAEFELHVLKDDIDIDILKDILKDAGDSQGVGAYRPRFGRFKLEKFTEKG